MASFTYLPGSSIGTRHQNQMRFDRLTRWERQCDLRIERPGNGASVIKVLTGVEGLDLTSTQIQLLNGMEELNNRCKLSGLSSTHAIQFAKKNLDASLRAKETHYNLPIFCQGRSHKAKSKYLRSDHRYYTDYYNLVGTDLVPLLDCFEQLHQSVLQIHYHRDRESQKQLAVEALKEYLPEFFAISKKFTEKLERLELRTLSRNRCLLEYMGDIADSSDAPIHVLKKTKKITPLHKTVIFNKLSHGRYSDDVCKKI